MIEQVMIQLETPVKCIKCHFLDSVLYVKKILTNSGGIQKEAYMLGVPCVTLWENTEWVETMEDGWNVLVGTDHEEIMDAIQGFEGAGERSGVFGKGDVSEMVCEVLGSFSS